MIPSTCKRLAEVDFPLAEVSRQSAREKSIRHGHPSTLHLWWARRPLAACRSILLALLWPDPCDENCPVEFKEKARELLPNVQGKVGPKDADLRRSLLKFIADFSNWDLSSNQQYLEVSRGLVKAAYGNEAPLVVDPFAGGGSIPLEALRVGCDSFASDLNPVACLILKVLLEDIPRCGPDLAEQLRNAGAEIKEEAEEELADLYPGDPDGSKPIAYVWARTVRCEAPNCGAEIPLMRSFWLCKKASRKRALRYQLEKPKDKQPCVSFEIFEPEKDKEVTSGTVTRAKATCLCCGTVLAPERVRAQLSAQRGGADVIFDEEGNRTGGARLLAVVTLKPGEQGRFYRVPTDGDYEAVWNAHKRLEKVMKEKLPGGLSPVPDEPTPSGGGSGAGRAFSIQKYGIVQWGNLFTSRQKLSLIELVALVRKNSNEETYQSSVISELVALAVGRITDQMSSLVRWLPSIEAVGSTFGRPALPIMWDFCEACPIGTASANFTSALAWVEKVTINISKVANSAAQVQQADATKSPLLRTSSNVFFTDPPYYDAVPYADLSDFFFVWLKRALPENPLLGDPYNPDNALTPKSREIVQNEIAFSEEGNPKDGLFYEESMARAFSEGRRILKEDGIGCVVFAHKTTEGWEALISGIIGGGWTITGSWPIITERYSRPRARDSAALGTSVHLICRPRPEDAPVGDWAEVLRELPRRVRAWMDRLQDEGVRGADLVFACIGPALEVYSRYSHVETAEGTEVLLAEYLQKVWEVVGRTALEQVLGTAEASGTSAALEEDARLTALFLWTLQSTDGEQALTASAEAGDEDEVASGSKPLGYSLMHDVVRRFAQPLGIGLPDWRSVSTILRHLPEEFTVAPPRFPTLVPAC